MILAELRVGQRFSFEFDGGITSNWIYEVLTNKQYDITVKCVKCPVTHSLNDHFIHDVNTLANRVVMLRE